MSRLHIDPNQYDFAALRNAGSLYVDKTRQIHRFLQGGTALMYTRPRRFGKSLMLSTVAAMYQGDAVLFDGTPAQPQPLWLYESGAWNWIQEARPVLQVSMNRLVLRPGETSGTAMSRFIRGVASSWGMTGHYVHTAADPIEAWSSLLGAVAQSYQPGPQPVSAPRSGHHAQAWLPPAPLPVPPGQRPTTACLVLLIDEYDAPVLNHLGHPAATALREDLANFYEVTKIRLKLCHRLILTGVTRFVREGLWSKLNHVTDVTSYRQHHDLTGFTDAELDSLQQHLDQGLPSSHDEGSLAADDLRTAWREWYNGYRFAPDARHRLYNPWSVMHSLQYGDLRDYWYDSGHLGALTEILQRPWTDWQDQAAFRAVFAPTDPESAEAALDLDLLMPTVAENDFAADQAILRHLPPPALTRLLHQAGYLTFSPDSRLRLPNREIARRIGGLLLYPYVQNEVRCWQHLDRVADALQRLHIPHLVTAFNQLLAQFPHQCFHTPAGGSWENPYHLLFEVAALGVRPQGQVESELNTLLGTADHVTVLPDAVLVTEIKAGSYTSADQAWAQIASRRYLQHYADRRDCLVGLGLHLEQRQITGWICGVHDANCILRGELLTHESAWPDDFDLRQHGLSRPAAPMDTTSRDSAP